MGKRGTQETEAKDPIDSARFLQTIRRMLSTPPMPHKDQIKQPKKKSSHRGVGARKKT